MSDDPVWRRIAWRNLGRHRGRTLITASALAFGYLAAVLMVGLMDGMNAELIENGTGLMVGQVQVHAADYLPERNMHRTIGGYEGIDLAGFLRRLESDPDIVAAAPRLYGGGLVSSGDQTLGGVLFGVDVRREGEVTTLLSTLREGRAPRAGAFEVAMGSEMARQLDVKVGDQVVLVAAAADGSMGNDLFTLAGVFSTGTPALDASHVLVPLPDLQYLLAMDPGRVHEVALTTTRPWDTPVIAASVERSLSAFGPPLRVRPWTELRPELAESVELMGSMNWVIIVIVFAMAIFGVANTMIIGTFERRKEFAVVRALGTTPLGVGKTVVYEGIFLGVLALAAGAVVTGPVLVWWHNRPPDLSGIVGGFAWSGSMWRPILRVEYSWDTPIVAAVALFVTSVLAAVYPAWKATRVPPADALAD